MVGDVSFALGVGGWGVAHAVVGGGMGRGMESVLGGMRGSCGALASQHLMLAALRSPQVAEEVQSNVKRYCRVRRGVSLLLSKVPMCRLVFPVTSGGLYVAVDVTPLGLTAQEVADVLLEEGGVCVVAVTHGGRQLIRLCISADEVALKDGVRKVAVTLMGLARDMLDKND
jgi:aspartate/methionine/tyrosine aminotransferase